MLPAFPVLLHVHNDPGPLIFLSGDEQVDDELKGLERIAPAADQKACVYPLDADDRRVVFPCPRDDNRGARLHVHRPQDAAHRIQRNARLAHVVSDPGHPDPRGFGANPENTGPPFAKNVYLDLGATGAEL